MGIVQRKLNNGMRVNMVSMGDEPQKVSVRLYVPGGRMLENRNKPGSVFVGSRTLQEGGAFLDVTRYAITHYGPSTYYLPTPSQSQTHLYINHSYPSTLNPLTPSHSHLYAYITIFMITFTLSTNSLILIDHQRGSRAVLYRPLSNG